MPAKKKYKLIVFEGIDGTGKTTLANMLAKEIDAQYYKTPPKEILPIEKFIKNSLPPVRLQYYRLANAIAEQELGKVLKKQNVVCDRYIYSTLSYQSAAMGEPIKAPGTLKPDFIVYTKANFNVVKKRLSMRKTTDYTEAIPFLKKVLKNYSKYLPKKNLIVIDTSKDNEQESFIKIMSQIKL